MEVVIDFLFLQGTHKWLLNNYLYQSIVLVETHDYWNKGEDAFEGKI